MTIWEIISETVGRVATTEPVAALMRGNPVPPHRAGRRQSRRLGLLPFSTGLAGTDINKLAGHAEMNNER